MLIRYKDNTIDRAYDKVIEDYGEERPVKTYVKVNVKAYDNLVVNIRVRIFAK
jgi:hypothetical protein